MTRVQGALHAREALGSHSWSANGVVPKGEYAYANLNLGRQALLAENFR